MKGWECPKCGQCFGPHVNKCDRCSAQPQQQPFYPTPIPVQPIIIPYSPPPLPNDVPWTPYSPPWFPPPIVTHPDLAPPGPWAVTTSGTIQ